MMAKKRRKHGTELTPEELEYLCCGYTVGGKYFGDPEPFASEQQAAEAWRNHADEVWKAFHAKEAREVREALHASGDYQDSRPWAARVFERAAG